RTATLGALSTSSPRPSGSRSALPTRARTTRRSSSTPRCAGRSAAASCSAAPGRTTRRSADAPPATTPSMSCATTPTPCSSGRWPPAPRWSAASSTRTTAPAGSPSAIPRATSGASAPTPANDRRLGARCDDAGVVGADDRGGAVADAQLGEDGGDVALDGAFAGVELPCDLGVVGPRGDQPEDLALTLCQRVDGAPDRWRDAARSAARRGEDPAPPPRIEPGAAPSRHPDRADEVDR